MGKGRGLGDWERSEGGKIEGHRDKKGGGRM